jgi:hypothetical protein
MRHRYAPIALLVLASAFLGCRTVWVHENWDEGRFEKDFTECRSQAHEARRVTSVVTRTCAVEADTGKETCTEEQSKVRHGPGMNWKTCMFARGWTTTVGSRSSPMSRAKGTSASVSRTRGK